MGGENWLLIVENPIATLPVQYCGDMIYTKFITNKFKVFKQTPHHNIQYNVLGQLGKIQNMPTNVSLILITCWFN